MSSSEVIPLIKSSLESDLAEMTRIFLLTLGTVLLCLLVGCEANAPSQPVSTFPNRVLYVGNWGFDEVYRIDLTHADSIDTLFGFGSVWDLTLTKSGKKLFVSTRVGSTNLGGVLYFVDVSSRVKTPILDQAADVYIRPDNVPLIVASTPNDTLRKLGTIDTVTGRISFFDSLDILDSGHNYEALVFDPNLPVFYTWSTDGCLFAYDFQAHRVTRRFNSVSSPPEINMISSHDGRLLFFANGPVIDVARDSIIGNIPAYDNSYLGSLALSPDGATLYLSDPAKYELPEPVPSGRIKIFETTHFSNIGFIDVNAASGQAATITDRMVLSADGTIGYVTDSISKIFVLNLTKEEVSQTIKFQPRNIDLGPIAFGTR